MDYPCHEKYVLIAEMPVEWRNVKEITISSLEAGQRFDKYLVKCLPNATKSFLYKMLRKKILH